jgi:hypothetical protein
VNSTSGRKKCRAFVRHKTNALFVSLWFLTWDAHAQPFVVNARAARFAAADPHAIAMEPAEKQALFGFYWAGSMMPATSACFRDIADPGCRDDLSPWMARELDDDPRFVRAYESARDPLGLPPLAAGAH